MGADGISVATTFAIQIGLAIIIFLAFSFLRLAPWARRFYAPKRFDKSLETKPQRLPPGMFTWMATVYNYPEEEQVKVSGLDSVMYIRVLNFGWEVFVKVSILVIIVILPIHLTGDRVVRLLSGQVLALSPPPSPPPPVGCPQTSVNDVVTAKQYALSTFDRCSMANIEAGSNLFWAHMICMYVITYIVLSTLWRYNKEATLLRLAFLANSPRGGPSHTVLITDIPGMQYGTVVWYLRSLIGSTLFIMLPQSLRKKILDAVEKAFGTVGNTLNMSRSMKHRQHMHIPNASNADPHAASHGMLPDTKSQGSTEDLLTGQPSSQDSAYAGKWGTGTGNGGPSTSLTKPKAPMPSDYLAVAAAENTRVAEEAEAINSRKRTGVLRQRRKVSMQHVNPHDQALDPWKQAGDVLGDAAEPRAHLVQGFIEQEAGFVYGPDAVAAVNPVWDQAELEPLLANYYVMKQKLEDYLDSCAYKLRRRKPFKKRLQVTVLGPTMGTWGIEKYGMKPVKVDAITFWSERLRHLIAFISRVQAQCTSRAMPVAFMTMNTRAAQVIVATALHHHDETTWQVQLAPEPKEIIWKSLSMRRWERSLRSVVLWIAYILLLCFFLIPIAAVQGLIEVPKLAKVPVLGTIVTLPFIQQILEGILPGLVLLIFLAICPILLAIMVRLSGAVSISQVDFGVVTRYYWFQVVSLFLGSIIAGSLFSQLKELVSNPTGIISVLGVAIPTTGTFFINYLLVVGIGKTGIKHLRVVGLVIFYILSKAASTPRARARLWADQYTLYGPNVPYFTIAFLLGMVYSVINPIIAPVVLIYFSFATISEKYNDLYVFKRQYESGGRLWYVVMNQFIIGLYFAQVLLIILLAIQKFKFVFFLIPCPIFTFGFHIACLVLFQRPLSLMSAHDAAMLDAKDQEERGKEVMGPEELQEIQDMYLSPAFKLRADDPVDLLKEAEIISRRIDGESLTDIEAALEERGGWASAEEEGDEGATPLTQQGATPPLAPVPVSTRVPSSGGSALIPVAGPGTSKG